MSSLIKQVFIVLLSFSSSFATNYVSFNDEPKMIRLTLIDLRISLDKCSGSCNVFSPKICIKNKRHKCQRV